MRIHCGNHGWNEHVYHDSTAEVRACFSGRYDVETPEAIAAEGSPDEEDAAQGTIWPEEPTHALNARARARKDDGWQKTSIKLDHVPPASYAIEHPDDGKLRFLEVEPGEGKWDGYIFVTVRAGDEWHKLGNVNPKYGHGYGGKAVALVTALAALNADELQQAAARYGQELGECGYCHLTLTDEDSRRLGYGPVCAGRHGLYHPKARAS
jgi:hypothetical protein